MGRRKSATASPQQPVQDGWQVFVEANDADAGTLNHLVVLQPPTANVSALRGTAAMRRPMAQHSDSQHSKLQQCLYKYVNCCAGEITRKYQDLHPGSAAACTRVQIAISEQHAAQRFLLFDTYNLKSELFRYAHLIRAVVNTDVHVKNLSGLTSCLLSAGALQRDGRLVFADMAVVKPKEKVSLATGLNLVLC